MSRCAPPIICWCCSPKAHTHTPRNHQNTPSQLLFLSHQHIPRPPSVHHQHTKRFPPQLLSCWGGLWFSSHPPLSPDVLHPSLLSLLSRLLLRLSLLFLLSLCLSLLFLLLLSLLFLPPPRCDLLRACLFSFTTYLGPVAVDDT